MKKILLILFVTLPYWVQSQNQSNFFDPVEDPIAVNMDSAFTLVVSEYVLAKSVESRLGKYCQVKKVYRSRDLNELPLLICEGIWLDKNRQSFTMAITLIPDNHSRYYYASNQALICSTPGCNNCSISNGRCVGCCSVTSEDASRVASPLSKISTKIE